MHHRSQRCSAVQPHLTSQRQLCATSRIGALCNVAVVCLHEAIFDRGARDGVYSKAAQCVRLRAPVAFLGSGHCKCTTQGNFHDVDLSFECWRPTGGSFPCHGGGAGSHAAFLKEYDMSNSPTVSHLYCAKGDVEYETRWRGGQLCAVLCYSRL